MDLPTLLYFGLAAATMLYLYSCWWTYRGYCNLPKHYLELRREYDLLIAPLLLITFLYGIIAGLLLLGLSEIAGGAV